MLNLLVLHITKLQTHSGQVIRIVFAVQQWICKGASMLRHTYPAYLVTHPFKWTVGFKSLTTDGAICERRCMKSRNAQITRLVTYSNIRYSPCVNIAPVLDSTTFQATTSKNGGWHNDANMMNSKSLKKKLCVPEDAGPWESLEAERTVLSGGIPKKQKQNKTRHTFCSSFCS
jgi:hypothetical protein